MKGIENNLLHGLKVLDLTKGPSGSYAGRLFVKSGAQVTKVCSKTYVFSSFKDKGKNVIFVENERDLQQHVKELLCEDWAIIMWDHHCSVELKKYLESFLQNNTRLGMSIGVCIDFPPNVDVCEENFLQAWGGWMELTGDSAQLPLLVGGNPATSLIAVHTVTAGLLASVTLNKHQSHIIRINTLTIMASALEGAVSTYFSSGKTRGRMGNRHHSLAPMSILPSKDGWVLIGAPVNEQWSLLESWAELRHNPEWLSEDGRMLNCKNLEEALSKWTLTKSNDELFHTGQTFRMPFAKVQSLQEVKDCKHLEEREFWELVDSEQQDMRLPWISYVNGDENKNGFDHIEEKVSFRIVDLTSMWSGPYCTRIFADLGIEVIKIEAPHRPDGIRANQEASASFFQELNRNKLGIELDLNLQTDRYTFLELIKSSDIVVDNYSPRVMRNFDLQTERLWEHHSELIHLSLSAFGQTGSYRDYVGYGPTLEAMSGIAALTHYDNGKPWLPGFSISDIAAGIYGAFALASALYFQKRNKVGIRIDLSQYEVACQLIGEQFMTISSPKKGKGSLPIRTLQDVANDEHVDKVVFTNQFVSLGIPWSCEDWKNPMRLPPKIGEHTRNIMASLFV